MLRLAGLRPMIPLVRASGQEPLQENAVLVQVLDGKSMVRAWPFEQLLEVVRGTLGGLLTPLAVGSGHERALAPLLVLLLVGTVGGVFIGVLVPLRLAFEAVKDRFDRLLTRGMAASDVEEPLGGSQALTS